MEVGNHNWAATNLDPPHPGGRPAVLRAKLLNASLQCFIWWRHLVACLFVVETEHNPCAETYFCADLTGATEWKVGRWEMWFSLLVDVPLTQVVILLPEERFTMFFNNLWRNLSQISDPTFNSSLTCHSHYQFPHPGMNNWLLSVLSIPLIMLKFLITGIASSLEADQYQFHNGGSRSREWELNTPYEGGKM